MNKINADVNGDGYHVEDKWEYHRYKVVLLYKGEAMGLTYRQGVGIDEDPTAQAILSCVLSDYIDADAEFEDWADNYGYNPDSRADEKIFRECREQSERFERMMGEDLPLILAQLNELGPEEAAAKWAGVTK